MSERTNYLSEAEVAAAQILPRDAPYSIGHVSESQFSIARFFGAVKFNGHGYTYFPQHDELVRDDVLKLVSKMRRRKGNAALDRMAENAAQLGLGYD